MYNRELIYSTGLNAYDAGSIVYDKEGEQIDSCYYTCDYVDPICSQLSDCKVIYRINNNI
jgi:hypothetical protein